MNLDLSSRVTKFSEVLNHSAWTDLSGGQVEVESAISVVTTWFKACRQSRKRLYIIGNGGSAGIASHASNDFINMCKISSHTFYDPSVLTCLTNDYGYEMAFARLLTQYTEPQDVLVAISSSGKSPNILNAVQAFRVAGGGMVLTLSGFKSDNPLRKVGDMNLWLDSENYGIVEIGHQFILHNVSDRIAAGI